MKKIISTLFMALTAVAMFAQKPVITFNEESHDFGKINEEDGKVTTVFTFKNEGMAPLIVTDVRPSCGCTKGQFTQSPVEPGQTGIITITYNPSGHGGHKINKSVTVTAQSTTDNSTTVKKLGLAGFVNPKQAKPANKYVLPVGELAMSTRVLDLGDIKKDDTRGGELEYANLSAEEHQVELATNSADGFLVNQVSLPTVQPKAIGKFFFAIEGRRAKLYGPVEAYAYVVVDGKKVLDEDHKITIKANLIEDFSRISEDEMVLAPKMVVDKKVDLGTFAKGQSVKGQINLLNIGVNPLQIRRVYSLDPEIGVKAAKSLKSGKKGAIHLDIPSQGKEAGTYVRQITIITNDPQQPQVTVTVNWTIE